MSNSQARIESILFDYETTNRTDFRNGEIKNVTYTYKEKPRCLRTRLPPLKDSHTLGQWKNQPLPFSFLHRPKDIVGTDPRTPWDVLKPFVPAANVEREQIQKSRPRVVMTPGVSLDDIADPKVRRALCRDMYISDMARSQQYAPQTLAPIKTPFTGHPAPADPLRLQKWCPPLVSPEWRMDTVTWENRQLRADCDSTKEFWLRRPQSKCKPCLDSSDNGSPPESERHEVRFCIFSQLFGNN